MLGIDDPQVWLAYLLCILSALFAVGYGVLHWDKGDEVVSGKDKKWVDGEKQAEDEL